MGPWPIPKLKEKIRIDSRVMSPTPPSFDRTVHPLHQKTVCLLTQHDKEKALGPLFLEAFSAWVEPYRGFNTDTLGTFARDIPRVGTQRATALKKAHLAAKLSQHRFGLGSEGSFLPGPLGLGSVNVEVLAFVDAETGLELVAQASHPGLHLSTTVTSWRELYDWTPLADFPTHGLLVRPDDQEKPATAKGVRDFETLRAAFEEAQKASASGHVFLEHDLRAHQHPQRMACIRTAGENLIHLLSSFCPECRTMGFGPQDVLRGLPCGECGSATSDIRSEVWKCGACPFQDTRPRSDKTFAEPAVCPVCNP